MKKTEIVLILECEGTDCSSGLTPSTKTGKSPNYEEFRSTNENECVDKAVKAGWRIWNGVLCPECANPYIRKP